MKRENLFVSFFVCLCSILAFGSQAQAVLKDRVPTAKIVDFGIYEIAEKGVRYEHKESTAGYATEGGRVVLVTRTTEIPLRKGISFGIEWEAEGLPSVPVRITYRIKHPRTTKPGGTVSTGFEEALPFLPEGGKILRRVDNYVLSEDWEMLPGEWSLAIVYEGNVLCEKVFHVVAQ
jgi:hypothetical protein